MTRTKNIATYSHEICGRHQEFQLVVLPSTFQPTPGSWALIRGLTEVLSRLPNGTPRKSILEVGCGSGIVSLAAANSRFVNHIVCLDKNPILRRAVIMNAALNGNDETGTPLSEKIRYTQSDLYDRLTESNQRFDWIVCNPPQRPTSLSSRENIGTNNDGATHSERVADQGKDLFKYHFQEEKDDDGLDFIRALLRDGRNLLRPGGKFYVQIVGWFEYQTRIKAVFEDLGLQPRIIESSRRAEKLDDGHDFDSFIGIEHLTGVPYAFYPDKSLIEPISASAAKQRALAGDHVWVPFMVVEAYLSSQVPTPAPELVQLLEDCYSLGSIERIDTLQGGVFDDLYTVHASKGKFVLRKNGYREGIDEIVYGEDFVVHLMDGGIPISALVPTRTGEYHVEQSVGQFYLLYEFMDGKQYAGENYNRAKILEAGYFIASSQIVLKGAELRGRSTPKRHPLPDKLDTHIQQRLLRDAHHEFLQGRDDWVSDPTKADFIRSFLEPGELEFIIRQLEKLTENLVELDYENASRVPIYDYLRPDSLFFVGDALNGIVDLNYSCSDIIAAEVAGWTVGPLLDLEEKRTQIWAMNRRFREKGEQPLGEEDLKFLPEMLRCRYLREITHRVDRLRNAPPDRPLPALTFRSFENLKTIDTIDWQSFLSEIMRQDQ